MEVSGTKKRIDEKFMAQEKHENYQFAEDSAETSQMCIGATEAKKINLSINFSRERVE